MWHNCCWGCLQTKAARLELAVSALLMSLNHSALALKKGRPPWLFGGFTLTLEDLFSGRIQLVFSFWVAGAPSQEYLLRRCERLLELLGCKYYFYSWILLAFYFGWFALNFRRPKSSKKRRLLHKKAVYLYVFPWICWFAAGNGSPRHWARTLHSSENTKMQGQRKVS